jgi:hypothetical protein
MCYKVLLIVLMTFPNSSGLHFFLIEGMLYNFFKVVRVDIS